MALRKFLLLVVVALVPFAMARQNPSDREASQTDLSQKDGQYEPSGLGLLIPRPPPRTLCLIVPTGTDGYEPSGLIHRCPPPPPATQPPPPPLPPTSPPVPPPTSPPTSPPAPTPAPTPAPV